MIEYYYNYESFLLLKICDEINSIIFYYLDNHSNTDHIQYPIKYLSFQFRACRVSNDDCIQFSMCFLLFYFLIFKCFFNFLIFLIFQAENGECVPCDGPCPKTCIFSDTLHAGNIDSLQVQIQLKFTNL